MKTSLKDIFSKAKNYVSGVFSAKPKEESKVEPKRSLPISRPPQQNVFINSLQNKPIQTPITTRNPIKPTTISAKPVEAGNIFTNSLLNQSKSALSNQPSSSPILSPNNVFLGQLNQSGNVGNVYNLPNYKNPYANITPKPREYHASDFRSPLATKTASGLRKIENFANTIENKTDSKTLLDVLNPTSNLNAEKNLNMSAKLLKGTTGIIADSLEKHDEKRAEREKLRREILQNTKNMTPQERYKFEHRDTQFAEEILKDKNATKEQKAMAKRIIKFDKQIDEGKKAPFNPLHSSLIYSHLIEDLPKQAQYMFADKSAQSETRKYRRYFGGDEKLANLQAEHDALKEKQQIMNPKSVVVDYIDGLVSSLAYGAEVGVAKNPLTAMTLVAGKAAKRLNEDNTDLVGYNPRTNSFYIKENNLKQAKRRQDINETIKDYGLSIVNETIQYSIEKLVGTVIEAELANAKAFLGDKIAATNMGKAAMKAIKDNAVVKTLGAIANHPYSKMTNQSLAFNGILPEQIEEELQHLTEQLFDNLINKKWDKIESMSGQERLQSIATIVGISIISSLPAIYSMNTEINKAKKGITELLVSDGYDIETAKKIANNTFSGDEKTAKQSQQDVSQIAEREQNTTFERLNQQLGEQNQAQAELKTEPKTIQQILEKKPQKEMKHILAMQDQKDEIEPIKQETPTNETKSKQNDAERLKYLRNRLSTLRFKSNLVTTKEAITNLEKETALVQEEISSIEARTKPTVAKEEALGIMLVDDEGNQYLPIKENGETSSGTTSYTVIDKNGNITVRDTKNLNYSIDPNGLKVIRDYDSSGKTIEERKKDFLAHKTETEPAEISKPETKIVDEKQDISVKQKKIQPSINKISMQEMQEKYNKLINQGTEQQTEAKVDEKQRAAELDKALDFFVAGYGQGQFSEADIQKYKDNIRKMFPDADTYYNAVDVALKAAKMSQGNSVKTFTDAIVSLYNQTKNQKPKARKKPNNVWNRFFSEQKLSEIEKSQIDNKILDVYYQSHKNSSTGKVDNKISKKRLNKIKQMFSSEDAFYITAKDVLDHFDRIVTRGDMGFYSQKQFEAELLNRAGKKLENVPQNQKTAHETDSKELLGSIVDPMFKKEQKKQEQKAKREQVMKKSEEYRQEQQKKYEDNLKKRIQKEIEEIKAIRNSGGEEEIEVKKQEEIKKSQERKEIFESQDLFDENGKKIEVSPEQKVAIDRINKINKELKYRVEQQSRNKNTPEDKAKEQKNIRNFEKAADLAKTTIESINDPETWDKIQKGEDVKGYQELKKLLDKHKKSMEDLGFDIGDIQNYLPHITQENINSIKKYGVVVNSFGQILTQPTSTFHRTGALENYVRSSEAIAAYIVQAETYNNLSEDIKRDIRTANAVAKAYQNVEEKNVARIEEINKKEDKSLKDVLRRQKDDETEKKSKGRMLFDYLKKHNPIKAGTSDVDFVEKVKDQNIQKDGFIYVAKKQTNKKPLLTALNHGFEGVINLANDVNSSFGKLFMEPFTSTDVKKEKTAADLSKLNYEQLKYLAKNHYSKEIYNPSKYTENELRGLLFVKNMARIHADAVTEFVENVRKSDFSNSEYEKSIINRIAQEYIGDNIQSGNPFEAATKIVRKMQSNAVIAFNVKSAMQNSFEISRAVATTSVIDTMNGFKAAFDKNNDLIGKYLGDSKSASFLHEYFAKNRKKQNWLSKNFNKYGYMPFSTIENFKDKVFLGAFESYGKRVEGLQKEALHDYVVENFNRYAIKFGKGSDAGFYKSDIVKTLAQYTHYAVKDASIFAKEINKTFHGDKKAQKYIAKYLITRLLEHYILAHMLKIRRKDDMEMPYDIISTVLTDPGQVFSPWVHFAASGAYWRTRALKGDELSEYQRLKRRDELVRRAYSSFAPAGAQFYKTKQAHEQQARGYDMKSHGRSVANLTGDGSLNKIRAYVFGKSYDSGRSEYLENLKKLEEAGQEKFAGLNEKESRAFERIYKEQGRQAARKFYNTVRDTNLDAVDKSRKLDSFFRSDGFYGDINEIHKRESGEKEKKKHTFMEGVRHWWDKPEEPKGEYLEDTNIKDLDQSIYKSIKANITKKMSLGYEISDKEYETYHLYDYYHMPEETRFQKMQKDKKGFSIAKKIYEDEDLGNETKEMLYKKMDIHKDEVDYHIIANERDDIQSEFIKEGLDGIFDDEDRFSFLLNQRAVVDSKMILTDTIIGKIAEEGYLSKQEGKFLKSVSFVRDDDYDGENYIMLGDHKYRLVEKEAKDTTSRGGGAGRSKAGTTANQWNNIKNFLSRQKSLNSNTYKNQPISNSYTKRSLSNILREVNPDNKNERLLSEILKKTKQGA